MNHREHLRIPQAGLCAVLCRRVFLDVCVVYGVCVVCVVQRGVVVLVSLSSLSIVCLHLLQHMFVHM